VVKVAAKVELAAKSKTAKNFIISSGFAASLV